MSDVINRLAVNILMSLQAIENEEGSAAAGQLQYTCRCSFLKIYNEQISDLLHPAEKPLALRYDSESGVYVENLTEHVVVNGMQYPCTASTPIIGPLQALDQDLRPQQITLPDPTHMFTRPNIWC